MLSGNNSHNGIIIIPSRPHPFSTLYVTGNKHFINSGLMSMESHYQVILSYTIYICAHGNISTYQIANHYL
jgi:hypothetical protein